MMREPEKTAAEPAAVFALCLRLFDVSCGDVLIRLFQKLDILEQIASVLRIQFLDIVDDIMHGDIPQIFSAQVDIAGVGFVHAKQIVEADFIKLREFGHGPDRNFAMTVFIV